MKTIPNKQTTVPSRLSSGEIVEGKFCLFSDLLKIALDAAPPAGFDPATLRARARVDKALEGVGSGDEIKFEDADYDTAQQAVKAVRWSSRHADYIALADAFGV